MYVYVHIRTICICSMCICIYVYGIICCSLRATHPPSCHHASFSSHHHSCGAVSCNAINLEMLCHAMPSFLWCCAMTMPSFLRCCAMTMPSFLWCCAMTMPSFLRCCAMTMPSFLWCCAMTVFIKDCLLFPHAGEP